MSDIYTRAIAVWGREAQVDMALEEMGELIVSLQQLKRGRVTPSAVCEEIADVKIMMRQMSVLFGEDECLANEKYKLSRLELRVTGAELAKVDYNSALLPEVTNDG